MVPHDSPLPQPKGSEELPSDLEPGQRGYPGPAIQRPELDSEPEAAFGLGACSCGRWLLIGIKGPGEGSKVPVELI